MERLQWLQQLSKLRELGQGIDPDLLSGLPGSAAAGQFLAQITIVLTVIGLILALLQCFFGYKLLRFWVALVGFLIGLTLGSGIMAATGENRPQALIVLVGITAGALLGILSFKLYLVGVFLYCGLLAAVIAGMLPFPDTATGQNIRSVLMIVLFLAGGILAVRFQRVFVVGITSFTGGLAAAGALRSLVPELSEDPKMAAAAAVILIVLGAAVQMLTTRGKKR